VVDLASVGRQCKLGEFEQGKLAEPYRRAVFEFNLGKAVFCRRKLKALLEGSVHWGFGPLRIIGPLHRDIALDETEADDAGT
jgi:hypothetical protein